MPAAAPSRLQKLVVATACALWMTDRVAAAQPTVSFAAAALRADQPTASAAPPGTARQPPPPPEPSDAASGHAFDPRLVLDTGRIAVTPPDPDTFRVQIHGEYQVRITGHTDPRLETSTGAFDTLGQTTRLYQWLRISPRLDYADTLSIIAQADVPRGFMLGQETHGVTAAEESYSERQPFRVDPRWLYAEWRTPIGAVRAGQQPWHYGMGIYANDGDHPELFGDNFGGDRVERVSFSPEVRIHGGALRGLVAADLVFADDRAKIVDGDRALQGVLGFGYARKDGDEIGVQGVLRRQRRRVSAPGGDIDERLDTLTLDSAGQFNAKLPAAIGHVFGQYEVAYVLGKTNGTRTIDEAAQGTTA